MWNESNTEEKSLIAMLGHLPADIELTILMPCLNEARTLPVCIAKAKDFMARSDICGEVLVADNGSTDGSASLARECGARVIDVPARGYGAALIAGIKDAKGRYIIMGDADDSYDFAALDAFVTQLRRGSQLVMGNRFKGGIAPKAMPFLHRYLGNPVLSALGRLFFRLPVGDFHCGLRGFDAQAIRNLHLQSPGMEFATEMVAKAAFAKLDVAEVPTTLKPDGRDRPPHLRTWRDGWRHLRFMLLFSPTWLFMGPGLMLLFLGSLGLGLLWRGPRIWGVVGFDVHTMLFCSAAVILGFQALQWGAMVQWLATKSGIRADVPGLGQWAGRALTLEHALAIGLLLLVGGVAWAWQLFSGWAATRFGVIESPDVLRQAILACTVMVIGLQSIGGSLCAAALGAVIQSGFRQLRRALNEDARDVSTS